MEPSLKALRESTTSFQIKQGLIWEFNWIYLTSHHCCCHHLLSSYHHSAAQLHTFGQIVLRILFFSVLFKISLSALKMIQILTLTHTPLCSFTHQHFRLVYFFSDLVYAGLLAVLYGEVTRASCDLKQEGTQHLHASLRQVDFRVKLHPIQFLLFIGNP